MQKKDSSTKTTKENPNRDPNGRSRAIVRKKAVSARGMHMETPKTKLSKEDEDWLVRCARNGVSQKVAANGCGMSSGTLYNVLEKRRDLYNKIEEARAQASEALAGVAYDIAMEGDVKMLIFLLKTRLGWRETNRLEVTGNDGAPVKHIALNVNMNESEARDAWNLLREGKNATIS